MNIRDLVHSGLLSPSNPSRKHADVERGQLLVSTRSISLELGATEDVVSQIIQAEGYSVNDELILCCRFHRNQLCRLPDRVMCLPEVVHRPASNTTHEQLA